MLIIDVDKVDAILSPLLLVKIGAAETLNPARVFPTDGANCRDVDSANPWFEYPGLIEGRERCALVVPSADKQGFTQVRPLVVR